MATVTFGFSFLTSGPPIEFSLPGDFDTLPELSSPLFNGTGGRSFDFVPAVRDEGFLEEGSLLPPLRDGENHVVELFERRVPPKQWYLRWRLGGGSVYTHLREEDGVAFAEVTVGSALVLEGGFTGTPSILPEPPLAIAVSARAGYQEEATFFSRVRGQAWAVTLRRPGFVTKGTIVELPSSESNGATYVRAGAEFGLDITVLGPSESDEPRDILENILATLREA